MIQTKTMDVAIVGAGPAGLMAAEILGRAGMHVTVFEAMPTPARKLLMAGKSGLNLTHSEAKVSFHSRYGSAEGFMHDAMAGLSANDVRAWADGLGADTFVGSSGRVFPNVMKASPLLRAWLSRLDSYGVTLKTRHRWTGWSDTGDLQFDTPSGALFAKPKATLLALGGASWPRLGSDGAWRSILLEKGIEVPAFKPANCGFNCEWSSFLKERFAGEPVKSVGLSVGDVTVKGDFIVSQYGVEGSAIYSISAVLRDGLPAAKLLLDLTPDRSRADLEAKLSKPRGKQSFATYLKKATGLTGVKAALLRDCAPGVATLSAAELAQVIKGLVLPITSARSINEAISVAGGVALDEFTPSLMLKNLPGVFCAGEMQDWEAPTGGYLITGCLAQGKLAAEGILSFLGSKT